MTRLGGWNTALQQGLFQGSLCSTNYIVLNSLPFKMLVKLPKMRGYLTLRAHITNRIATAIWKCIILKPSTAKNEKKKTQNNNNKTAATKPRNNQHWPLWALYNFASNWLDATMQQVNDTLHKRCINNTRLRMSTLSGHLKSLDNVCQGTLCSEMPPMCDRVRYYIVVTVGYDFRNSLFPFCTICLICRLTLSNQPTPQKKKKGEKA